MQWTGWSTPHKIGKKLCKHRFRFGTFRAIFSVLKTALLQTRRKGSQARIDVECAKANLDAAHIRLADAAAKSAFATFGWSTKGERSEDLASAA
jgi:hypothetical protein